MTEKFEFILLPVEVNQNNKLTVAQNLTIRKLLVTRAPEVHKNGKGKHQIALRSEQT